MAKVTLQIVAQVRDQASAALKNVNRGLKDTSDAANKAKFNFTELNRALFSTKAFFGMFSKVFTDFKQGLTEAANLDRVETSFKNVFGQNSDILQSLDKFSSIGVDRTAAMKEAISLGMLGIAKSSDQAAQILAGAAYGAKQAGVDTTEAMHKIVQGMKDGSLSGLEYLNTIRSSDPALKAQLALLNKYSGTISGAVTAQAKYNIILNITNRLSQLAQGNQEDLVDSMARLDNSISRLKQTFGTFLGKAFGGMITSIRSTIDSVNQFIQTNTKNNKGLIHLAKNFTIATAAAGGFYVALNSIYLVNKILASAGVGFPFLKGGILGLGLAFLTTTSKADGLVAKLKLFGNMIEGVIQLVTSFDPATGLSKIDEDIANILKKNGIWTLAQNIARAGLVIKTVIESTADIFNNFSSGFMSAINPVINGLQKLLGIDSGPWSRDLVDKNSKIVKSLGSILAVYLGFKAAKSVFGFLSGPLSGVTGLLKGGGGAGIGGGALGSPSNPMYVKEITLSSILPSILGKMGGGGLGGLGGLGDILKPVGTTTVPSGSSGATQTIAKKFGELASNLVSSIPIIGRLGPVVAGALAVIGTATAGYQITKAIGSRTPGIGQFFDPAQAAENEQRRLADQSSRRMSFFSQQFKQQLSEADWQKTLKPIGPAGLTQKAFIDQFKLPAGAPTTGPMASLEKEAAGIDPKTGKVSYMPNIPDDPAAQLRLLERTRELTTSSTGKDIMQNALMELREAILTGSMDYDRLKDVTTSAYINARNATKDPQHNTNRRGC